MKYQGYEVNFSQIDSAQQKINSSVNLALYKYPQNPYLASARSDSDIWKHIGEQIQGTAGNNEHYSWGANPNALNPRVNRNTNAIQALDTAVRQIISQGTGSGMTRQQVEKIIEDYHGDDVALLYRNHEEQENRITDGFNARKEIDVKIEKMFNDHDKFYSTLGELGKTDTTLGNKLVEAKNERDRIEALIGQGGKDCGFLGINCIFDNLLPNVSSTALLAGAGVAAYLLLGKKK